MHDQLPPPPPPPPPLRQYDNTKTTRTTTTTTTSKTTSSVSSAHTHSQHTEKGEGTSKRARFPQLAQKIDSQTCCIRLAAILMRLLFPSLSLSLSHTNFPTPLVWRCCFVGRVVCSSHIFNHPLVPLRTNRLLVWLATKHLELTAR